MPRAGLSRQRLALAGAELADEIGFDQVTVSALARRFDVKAASLYSHLRGSHELKSAIALVALAEMADRAADAVAGRSGRGALFALADVYRDYARQHPGRYAASQYRLDAEAAARSAGPRHTRVARAVLRGYDLPESEHTHAVRLLGGLLHGYVSLEAGGSFSHSAPGTEQSWQRTRQALDALLRNWPTPSTCPGSEGRAWR